MNHTQLQNLRQATGKSLRDCKQALEMHANDFDAAAQSLFANELEEIKSRLNDFNAATATKALIQAKGNLPGALSILTHGYDTFRKDRENPAKYAKIHSADMIYDKAKWHYGGDYPHDLPPENAAIHIGMFITWCVETNLISSQELKHNACDIDEIKKHKLTGAAYLIKNCSETFSPGLLNEEGNDFASAYYEDDTPFAREYHAYGDDFCETFNKKAAANGFEYRTLYHVEDTWANYGLIAAVITQRYQSWRSQRLPSKQ